MERIKFRLWDRLRGTMHVAPVIHFGKFGWGVESPLVKADCQLMQFTGLIDDNGVEIYEKDIVEDILGERCVVEWNDDTCCFQFSNGFPINNGETYGIYKLVVGNVWQNPELVK